VCRLLEDLIPFLDHDINDPAAAQLGSQLKRKQQSEPSANKVQFWHTVLAHCNTLCSGSRRWLH
jgi:hypothetical protein